MKERHRIPGITAFLMLSVAVLVDIFQVLLSLTVILAILAPIFAGIGWFMLWLWFKLRGVTFFESSTRMMTNIMIVVLEFIPLVDVLPGLTIGTWITIRSVWKDDKEHNARLREKQREEQLATQAQISRVGENKNRAAYYNRDASNDNGYQSKAA